MLVRLAVALMLTGMASDALKDLLLGRDFDLSTLVMDNLLKLMGFTKYQIYQSREDGLGTAIMQYFFSLGPLVKTVDDVVKDAQDISSGKMEPKDARTLNAIPLIGKFYYWWYGGGHAKLEKQRNS